MYDAYISELLPRVQENRTYIVTDSDNGLIPANMRRWPTVGLLLTHRLRRWPNGKPTLGQRLMFAGISLGANTHAVTLMISV